MIEIIPAIMPKTIGDISEKVSLVNGLTRFVQIDVMDGIFVPNKSWPYSDFSEFEELIKEDSGLPYWQDVEYEFDLMIENPLDILDGLISLGAGRIVFHIEGGKVDEIIEAIEKAKEVGVEVGVSLKNDTPLEDLSQFVDKIDFVQLMGISDIVTCPPSNGYS